MCSLALGKDLPDDPLGPIEVSLIYYRFCHNLIFLGPTRLRPLFPMHLSRIIRIVDSSLEGIFSADLKVFLLLVEPTVLHDVENDDVADDCGHGEKSQPGPDVQEGGDEAELAGTARDGDDEVDPVHLVQCNVKGGQKNLVFLKITSLLKSSL